jgi:hypothetical protein
VTWSQSIARWLARTLGFENATAVDDVHLSFGSAWAQNGPAWVLFACLAACAVAFLFYLRAQSHGRRSARIGLAVLRAVLLCLLVLILADPILRFRLTSQPKPALWVLVDGTDSMGIADEYTGELRSGYETAVDWKGYQEGEDRGQRSEVGGQQAEGERPTRADYVRALLAKQNDNLLEKLAEKYRVRTYVFDRADGVRPLTAGADDAAAGTIDANGFDPAALAAALTTDGQVTALGNAIEDVALRHATNHLAGLLVVSDFAWNAGRAPDEAARKLKVPVYTLGVGARSAVDLELKLYSDPKMKKAETSTITVTLRQRDLDGRTVPVRVVARRPEGEAVPGEPLEIVVGERDVALDAGDVTAEFPFRPDQTGRWVFHAEVPRQEGEIVDQNNRDEREVTIIDDFLRLLFVEYEPTYEWRFVKEVFHRDKLVGLRGFRTFLRSSDPIVREQNELFVPTLTLQRKEFFEHDVIFLSDMPRETMSTRFLDMTKEFVEKFGGGLVVIAGPRFGPGELADTPIADMLPVVLDPDGRIRDDREFTLRRTPQASQYDFMNLGDAEPGADVAISEERSASDNERAWANFDRVPWYQPVKGVEPYRSTVLAEHPTDKTLDGRTPQPLIAIRKYGRGEVVYVGFNEMWRLRRKYGEVYYRRFWGQLIHRMGLSHALGSQKRFVVRTDRQRYDADDKVLLTVEAYDDDFQPLKSEDLPDKVLHAELHRPGGSGEGEDVVEPLRIAQSDAEKGLYEVRVPVFEGGQYRVVVKDPIADDEKVAHFQVTSLSVERRKAVRNDAVQRNLALSTGGKAYELDTVNQLLTDFNPPRLTETTVKVIPLWSTWLCFGLLVGLMLTEWSVRKLVNLP